MTSVEPYVNGKPHGTASQWDEGGRLIGTYTMRHGTGVARAILVKSMKRLCERGMAEVLRVDAETQNGALRLYECVGLKLMNRDA